jgi:hypothetical protein
VGEWVGGRFRREVGGMGGWLNKEGGGRMSEGPNKEGGGRNEWVAE